MKVQDSMADCSGAHACLLLLCRFYRREGNTVHLAMRTRSHTAKIRGMGAPCASLYYCYADVTEGSTIHLVMRPVDTSQPPPSVSTAEGAHIFHPHMGGMGGAFPMAFRGPPNGNINPNDFGSVSAFHPCFPPWVAPRERKAKYG
jgi:hypothetical protein